MTSHTTSASSVTTGALQVAGGVGIKGSLYAANLYSGGNLVSTQNDLLNYNTKSEIAAMLDAKASIFSVQSPLTYSNNVIGLDSSAITSWVATLFFLQCLYI